MGPKIGWGRDSGITRLWQTVLARFMGTQIWHLPAGFMGAGLRKVAMVSASTSILLGESTPLFLALNTDNSVPFHIFLMLFELVI